MTDMNDGTYEYYWTPTNEGTVTIQLVHYRKYSILGTYYNTMDLTGAVMNANYSTHIMYDWGTGNVTANKGDQVSSKYEAFLKAPISGSVTLYIYYDNFAALWVDGVQKFNVFGGSPGVAEKSAAITMVKDQYYHIEVHFAESGGYAFVNFTWSYSGYSKGEVPSSAWFYPQHINSSPWRVTVACPSGYTGTNATNPNVCSEI